MGPAQQEEAINHTDKGILQKDTVAGTQSRSRQVESTALHT